MPVASIELEKNLSMTKINVTVDWPSIGNNVLSARWICMANGRTLARTLINTSRMICLRPLEPLQRSKWTSRCQNRLCKNATTTTSNGALLKSPLLNLTRLAVSARSCARAALRRSLRSLSRASRALSARAHTRLASPRSSVLLVRLWRARSARHRWALRAHLRARDQSLPIRVRQLESDNWILILLSGFLSSMPGVVGCARDNPHKYKELFLYV